MAKRASAGQLRFRVELQRATETRDAIGGVVETWETYATVWAAVEQMSARESWWRQQMNASAAWRVTLRWLAGVTTKHRVLWQGRTFEVRGVTDVEQRRVFIELACDELVAP